MRLLKDLVALNRLLARAAVVVGLLLLYLILTTVNGAVRIAASVLGLTMGFSTDDSDSGVALLTFPRILILLFGAVYLPFGKQWTSALWSGGRFSYTRRLVYCLVLWAYRKVKMRPRRRGRDSDSWTSSLLLDYLDPCSTTLKYAPNASAVQPPAVGDLEHFVVRHYNANQRSHVCDDTTDEVTIEVCDPGFSPVEATVDCIPGSSVRRISFATRKAGNYSVAVKVSGIDVQGSPLTQYFQPGPIKVSSTEIDPPMVYCAEGEQADVKVKTFDRFGNPRPADGKFGLRFNEGSDAAEAFHESTSFGARVLVHVAERGRHKGALLYESDADEIPATELPAPLTIVVLSNAEKKEADENLENKQQVWYEAEQISDGPAQRVYVYIAPTQIYIKNSVSSWFFAKYLLWKSFSMRIKPSSEFTAEGSDLFTLCDRVHPPVTLTSPKRDVILATYYGFLRERVGGSNTFERKRKFFGDKMKELSTKSEAKGKLMVKIRRRQGMDFVKEVVSATRTFSVDDWRRKWNVVFIGERGLDYGGLFKEMMQLLGIALFSPSDDGLFCILGTGTFGLAHPNANVPRNKEVLRFAGKIVGKSVYEAVYGRHAPLPARFARSFLASVLGLRAHFDFFQTDDPELYTSKVKYILDNSVEGLDMFFTEEERRDNETVEVDLKPGGSNIEVTDANKIEYLNLLAHHRLEKKTSAYVRQFCKGLNDVVPDSLLSMFDENELELLVCGQQDYHVNTLKEHCVIRGAGKGRIPKHLVWFFHCVGSFTREERSRLLQFVTGSGVLPLDGFEGLRPPFEICLDQNALAINSLPEAHTCFNQLVLPRFSSIEALHRSFVTAITEGNEGFSLL